MGYDRAEVTGVARRRAIPFVGAAWSLELRRDVGDGRDVAGDHVEASRPHELVRRAPAEAAVGGDLEVAVTASDEDDTAQGGPAGRWTRTRIDWPCRVASGTTSSVSAPATPAPSAATTSPASRP